ncbi:MAG: Na+/H+ antiporter subunit E [Alphaproteobacteria bacterium]|nr:Na+/H+ antiporter subunit E [Rickettsiales bacterium]
MQNFFKNKKVKMFLFLVIFWVLLSGLFHTQLLVWMVLSSIATVAIMSKIGILPDLCISKKGLTYIPFMLKNMVVSTVQVLRLINGQNIKFTSSVSRVTFRKFNSDINILMNAAAITMTPGTAVVSVDKSNNTMLVHGIDKPLLNSLPDTQLTKIIGNKRVSAKKIKPFVRFVKKITNKKFLKKSISIVFAHFKRLKSYYNSGKRRYKKELKHQELLASKRGKLGVIKKQQPIIKLTQVNKNTAITTEKDKKKIIKTSSHCSKNKRRV